MEHPRTGPHYEPAPRNARDGVSAGASIAKPSLWIWSSFWSWFSCWSWSWFWSSSFGLQCVEQLIPRIRIPS
jgi:hypothetical protein